MLNLFIRFSMDPRLRGDDGGCFSDHHHQPHPAT